MSWRPGLLLPFILILGIHFHGCSQLIIQKKSEPKMPKSLIKPPYLKAGDTVAIVAPSGILLNAQKDIDSSVALLKTWGLEVILGDHLFEQDGHFAGTDSLRITDLQKMIDDKKVKAIWSARGGYGTVRVIDEINYKPLQKNPKWIIGYSDITALHNDLHNQGIESIHAMMCTSLTNDRSEIEQSLETFRKAIFGEALSYSTGPNEFNKEGTATAQLVGGNLTLLHTMLGSRSEIDTDGKIIFFEEIGEYEYHIDRMLQSLKRAGYFDKCAGIVVGDISNIRVNTTAWGKPVEQLILDVMADYDFPILFGFPAGHERDNRALILGREVELSVTKEGGSLKFNQ